jgi:hypothetical protein
VAGVEEARKENDNEAIADTSGRTCYGWGEKAGGAQIVDSGKEECMGSGSIGEMHVDILRCRRESWGLGKAVGHFCYVIIVIGVSRTAQAETRAVLRYPNKELRFKRSLHCR